MHWDDRFDLVYTGIGALCWLGHRAGPTGRRAVQAAGCTSAKVIRCCGDRGSGRPARAQVPYFERRIRCASTSRSRTPTAAPREPVIYGGPRPRRDRASRPRCGLTLTRLTGTTRLAHVPWFERQQPLAFGATTPRPPRIHARGHPPRLTPDRKTAGWRRDFLVAIILRFSGRRLFDRNRPSANRGPCRPCPQFSAGDRAAQPNQRSARPGDSPPVRSVRVTANTHPATTYDEGHPMANKGSWAASSA
jgi:hypothetical protein